MCPRLVASAPCRAVSIIHTRDTTLLQNVLDKLPQWLQYPAPRGDKAYGGALASGDDQTLAPRQLLWGAHFNELPLRIDAFVLLQRSRGLAQELDMLAEGALQREDANCEIRDSDCHCACLVAMASAREAFRYVKASESYTNAAKV